MAAVAGAGGPPAVAPPPITPTTFSAWYGANADPYTSVDQLLQPFRDAPNVVDNIYTSLTTTTYPLPLLVNGDDGLPHVVLMPFNENTLPVDMPTMALKRS